MAVVRGWKQARDERDAQQRASASARPAPVRMATYRVQPQGGSGGSFVDRMLGRGASQAFGARPAPRPQARVAAASPRPSAPQFRQRVEMVGDQAPAPSGRKGFIRLVLVGGMLLWAAFAFKPWRHVGDLAHALRSARGAHGKAAKAEPRPKAEDPILALLATPAPTAAPSPEPTPQGTPVVKLAEAPAALFKGGDGRWYAVDRLGYAEPCAGPEDPAYLGLPFLRGCSMRPTAEGKSWRLKVTAASDLARVLPLHPALATEVESVDVASPSEPTLRCADGSVVLLGRGETRTRQAWLAAVLADLAAKGKRASTIDLRFRGQAVVRLASR